MEKGLTMYDKLETFFLKHIPIHIVKKDNEWANGFIDELSINFFIINEFKKGMQVIFIEEIQTLETYTYIKKEGEE